MLSGRLPVAMRRSRARQASIPLGAIGLAVSIVLAAQRSTSSTPPLAWYSSSVAEEAMYLSPGAQRVARLAIEAICQADRAANKTGVVIACVGRRAAEARDDALAAVDGALTEAMKVLGPPAAHFSTKLQNTTCYQATQTTLGSGVRLLGVCGGAALRTASNGSATALRSAGTGIWAILRSARNSTAFVLHSTPRALRSIGDKTQRLVRSTPDALEGAFVASGAAVRGLPSGLRSAGTRAASIARKTPAALRSAGAGAGPIAARATAKVRGSLGPMSEVMRQTAAELASTAQAQCALVGRVSKQLVSAGVAAITEDLAKARVMGTTCVNTMGDVTQRCCDVVAKAVVSIMQQQDHAIPVK